MPAKPAKSKTCCRFLKTSFLKTSYLILAIILACVLILVTDKLLMRKNRGVAEEKISPCQTDNDCFLAINPKECCACPKAVSQEALKKDKNLTAYVSDKKYLPNSACRNVACAPCQFWEKAICQTGICKEFSSLQQD